MAIINIQEQFWRDITKVVAAIGNTDQAIGQVVRFLDLCQMRYKSCRVISDSEFAKEGFNPALEGVFAERVDGGWMAIGADKNFGWLRKRVTSGRNGGLASGKARRSDFNDLERSKTKQNEANSSKRNPLSLSLSLDDSKESSLETVSNSTLDHPPPIEPARIQQLADLWNQHVPSLPRVKSTVGKRRSLILRALKENSDLAYWAAVFTKVEASDFLSGRNGRWTACNFDWILGNDKHGTRNHIRVDEGVHDNRAQIAQVQRNQPQVRNWVADAEMVLQAVRRFGTSQPELAAEELGPELWGVVRAVGGLYRIGQMPLNDFTSKTLAGMLKVASENLKNKPSERTAKNASHEHTNKEFHVSGRRGDQAGPDQSGGRTQRSGQDDDIESLRVRSEGLIGFDTGSEW